MRKLAVSAISVSFASDQSHIQLMVIFSLLYINHQMTKSFEPYQEKYINQIDLQSSTASIFAIILGLMFLRGNSARSTTEMELVFWVLLFFNSLFVIRWAAALSKIYIDKVQRRVLKSAMKPKDFRMAPGFHYDRKNFQKEAKRQQKLEMEEERAKNVFIMKLIDKEKTAHIPDQLEQQNLPDILRELNDGHMTSQQTPKRREFQSIPTK